LKDLEIPLAARILTVVEVYDALTSVRTYRKAWSKNNTRKHIRQGSGKNFDP
jgi:HD-GYP domain-containing protein (c-di-GMP phosphodiesterase class II)